VTGTVAAITPTEISVDLGTKQSGYIPLSELTDDPTAKAEDMLKIGDPIDTFVMRVNDVEGTVMLSKSVFDSIKSWEEVEKARLKKQRSKVSSPRKQRRYCLLSQRRPCFRPRIANRPPKGNTDDITAKDEG
jgi:ribosomal protein S1